MGSMPLQLVKKAVWRRFLPIIIPTLILDGKTGVVPT